jgi:hypothetical protein
VPEYRRRRKRSGKSYSARRPYVRRLVGDKYGGPRLGGGGYGPRNYIRTHDFRYEREQPSRPPKTETRYEVVERPSTESYRQPTFHRPELDQASMEKAVGQAMERYLRNESERSPQTEKKAEAQQDLDVGTNPLAEIVTTEAETREIDATEPIEVDPLSSVEVPQETDEPMIEPNADPLESYELPIGDLELLLIELDANPLEVQPERNIEPGPAEEQ